MNGTVSCNNITFGTVGGETTFSGLLTSNGLAANGSYTTIFGDNGTWSGGVTAAARSRGAELRPSR